MTIEHTLDSLAYDGETQLDDQQPLIETPVDTRLRAYSALPQLLKEIGRHVEFKPAFDPDKIPF